MHITHLRWLGGENVENYVRQMDIALGLFVVFGLHVHAGLLEF